MTGKEIYCFEVASKYSIVEWFYEVEDDNFHKNIHKFAGTVEENIKDTLDSISDSSVMYVVNVDGKLAAYFVYHKTLMDELVLEGFHILKEFRNRPFLTEFWQIVKHKFNGAFKTGIYCRNEPALKSLIKAGFEFDRMLEFDKKLFIILKCN